MAVLVTYNGSGKTLSFGSEKEGVTYSYSSLSSLYLITENYGLITDSYSAEEDYGSISEYAFSSEDYKSISTQETNPSFGSIKNIISTTRIGFSLLSVGGIQFALQGGSYESFGSPFIGYGLTKQIGGLAESSSPTTYVGQGSLFGFSGAAERISFSYNESSVALFTSENYGFISSAEEDSEDYGLIVNSPTTIDFENYGSINVPSQDVPFGDIQFTGDAARTTRFNLRYIGSGSLFAFIGAAEATIPSTEITSGLFRISGAAAEVTIPSTEIGSGVLFSFIRKEERRTYSYNGSSVALQTSEDYGFISQVEQDSEEYGLISDTSTITNFENYGLITSSGIRPFGTLNFVGDASRTTRFRLRYFGFGSLFTFIGSTEATTPAPEVASGLFRISGAASDLRSTQSEVGSGTLFSFITKEERRTYSYNGSSVVGDVVVDDYGLISELHQQLDDYGSIWAVPVSYEDYYYLQNIPSKKPYGFLRFASAAVEKNTESYVGSGTLFAFTGAAEATTPSEEAKGLFRISGAASDLRSTQSEVGSGTLFSFITKEERRTYSYNGSSVVFEFGEDYGFISSAENDFEDYGLITGLADSVSSENYGFITTRDKRPYGFLRFASAVVEKNTESYVGSGSLFTFIGSTEATTPAPEVASGLFRISGAATESITPTTEIGSGTLFSFITKEERRTYSYNSSSVVGEFTTEDYGFISAIPQSFEDYGDLLSTPVLYDDYNTLFTSIRKPYGFLSFSGGATNLQSTLSYFGRGGLFALTGSAESVSFVPQTTGLFKFVSGTTEGFGVGLYTGSGSLFTFIRKEESKTFSYVGSIKATISGAASDIKNTQAQFGSGRLFAYTGSANIVGYNPPATGLFKFLATGATDRFVGSYVSSGVIPINLDPGSAVYDPNEKIRVASALESRSVAPFIPPGGFRVQGEVGRIFFQYGESGAGRFTIAGEAIVKTNPIHFGTGSVNVRGLSSESTVPAPHVGSGSLFGFVSGTESTAPAPEIGSGLFRIAGAATGIKETTVEVGSGNLGPINVESNIIIRFVYPVNCELSITGTTEHRKLNSYDGSGRILPSGSADIYYANKFFAAGDPIRIRATDTPQSSTKTFNGSGALFGFVSFVESTGANPPVKTTAFKVTGSAFVANTESFKGSGTITERQATAIDGEVLDLTPATIAEYADEIISDYARIPVIAIRTVLGSSEVKQRIVGAFESASASPVSEDRAIKIIGKLESEVLSSRHIGFGKLFGFDSLNESASFAPADIKVLFEVTGNAEEKSVRSVSGSGGLFGFGNSADSVLIDYSSSSGTIDPEDPTKVTFKQNILIRVNGSLSESFIPAPHTGSGTLSAFTGSSESRTFSSDNKILFEFTGSSPSSLGKTHTGTGTVFAFAGSSRSFIYNYELTQKVFKIFGNTFESFGKSNYLGQCETQFIGKSTDEKVNYDTPKPTILYVI